MLWNVRSVRARSGIFLPQVSTFPISQPQDGGHVEVHAKTKGLDISKQYIIVDPKGRKISSIRYEVQNAV